MGGGGLAAPQQAELGGTGSQAVLEGKLIAIDPHAKKSKVIKKLGCTKVPLKSQTTPATSALTVGLPQASVDMSKTAKDDDAQVPVEFWDLRILSVLSPLAGSVDAFVETFGKNPLDTVRSWLLRVWRHNITREGLKYFKHQVSPSPSELEGVCECITKAALADWWDWPAGSRIIFPRPNSPT